MMRIYVNGIEQSEKLSFSGPINIVTYPLKFGIAPHSGVPYAFNGKIDEAAIYNRALPVEEIQQHYQDGLIGLGYEVECVTPPEDLVSWWPGDGNAGDIVGNNDGTVYDATYAPGKVDQAFSFDGAGDYVDCGNDASLDITSELTIDAWINRPNFSTHGTIVGKTNGDSAKAGYGLFSYREGVELAFYSGGGWRRTLPRVAITANEWHHIAGTFDGSNLYLYVDGEQKASLAYSGTIAIATGYSLHIAYWRPGLPTYFEGTIDEVEIFNRALSQSEIQAIYNAGSAGKCKVIDVEIDIKPGSDPNSINLGEHGVLPVAILGSPEFDVAIINPETIELGGVSVAARGSKKAPKLAYSLEDVDGDGYIDMMTFFDVQELVSIGALTGETTELLLTAALYDDTPIKGTDSVNIVH